MSCFGKGGRWREEVGGRRGECALSFLVALRGGAREFELGILFFWPVNWERVRSRADVNFYASFTARHRPDYSVVLVRLETSLFPSI